MFSDSICEIICKLLDETLLYSLEPFEYSLHFEVEILDVLENLIYIQLRLDNHEMDKFKKSKILNLAKVQAKKYIDQIRKGENPFPDD